MAAIEQDVEQYPDGSTRLEESKDKDEETHELSEEDLEKTAKDFSEYLIVNSKQEVGELYPWTMTSPFSASPLYRSINLTRGFKVSSFVSKSFNDSWSGCIKTLRVPQRKSLSSTLTLVNSQTCLTRLTRLRSDRNFENILLMQNFEG